MIKRGYFVKKILIPCLFLQKIAFEFDYSDDNS